MMHPDDEGFTYASDTEWDRAAASELGGANPNQAWILTDRDVWYKNPYYHGPAVPHPEEEEYYDENDVNYPEADEIVSSERYDEPNVDDIPF